MAFRIFISHSSHSEKEKRFVRKLAKCLDAAGYQALLDMKELKAGDSWNEELHEWLAACHAGILLLTPHSIGRPWVLKEATILTHRLARDEKFKLFPVRGDDLTDEMLEQEKFSPLVLGAIQKVAGRKPEAIAKEIKGILGKPVETEAPLDRLANVLADLLVPPKAGKSTAERLARKLGIDETRWVRDEPPDLSRVTLVAGRLVRESLGTYKDLYELMKDLRETMTDKEDFRKVLAIVAPFWVSPDAAGRLCEVACRTDRWAAAMNGEYLSEFTVEMYLLRAFPLEGELFRLELAGGYSENAITEIIQDIYASLKSLWKVNNDLLIKKMLETHPDPLFVVLPKGITDEAALHQLEAEFPHLTFILNAGTPPAALEPFARQPRVQTITAIDPNIEETRYLDYLRATGLLN